MCNERVRPPANECMTDWLRNWEAPVVSLGLNTECGILCGSQLLLERHSSGVSAGTACVQRVRVVCLRTVLLREQGKREGRGSDFFGESSDLPLQQVFVLFPTFLWHRGRTQMFEI